jgi:hypothetical protein
VHIKNGTAASLPRWFRTALALLACCYALPAAAEGGYFPSLGVLFVLALAYLLLVPIIAMALVYGTMKLVRPQQAVRCKRVFVAAFCTWIAGMLIFNYSSLGHYLSDSAAIAVGGVLVLGIAFGTAFFVRDAKPPTAN